jgi:hypothetical protein
MTKLGGNQPVMMAVVGSRDYEYLDEVKEFVAVLPANVVVISGGARGVDTVAVQTAQERGILTIVYKPNWRMYGKSAGPIRNQRIVDECDCLAAFWNGKSPGTLHSIRCAVQQRKSVVINPKVYTKWEPTTTYF